MATRQRTFGPAAGNFSRMPVSRQTPSRCGPSHCGQSSADKENVTSAASRSRIVFMDREIPIERELSRRAPPSQPAQNSCQAHQQPIHEPTHPRPLPGGEQTFVRAAKVPLLGGVKGWVHGPNRRAKANRAFPQNQGGPPDLVADVCLASWRACRILWSLSTLRNSTAKEDGSCPGDCQAV